MNKEARLCVDKAINKQVKKVVKLQFDKAIKRQVNKSAKVYVIKQEIDKWIK